jgi:ABC-type nitrate/sulfonate/bicarbonate transport system substrate-binding protein
MARQSSSFTGAVFACALVVGVACTPAPLAPQPTPPRVQSLQIDVAVRDAPYAFYFIGIERGYYAEEGLSVELVSSAGSTSVASVLAGEMPFTTASSASLSAILKGGPLKIILTNMDRPAYELWSSQPEIRTLADLQGKSVGIISRGDTMEVSTRLAMRKAGLDADSIAFTPLGPGTARLAAVQSGAVAAAVLGIGDAYRLRQEGPKGNEVADLGQEVRMLFNGLATSDRLLREDPGFVTRFLRATIKSREYFRAFKDETLAIVSQYNGAPREVNEPDYDSIVATFTPDGTLPEDVQVADAGVRAELIGAPTVRSPAEIYDYSLARTIYAELKRSGWQPKA